MELHPEMRFLTVANSHQHPALVGRSSRLLECVRKILTFDGQRVIAPDLKPFGKAGKEALAVVAYRGWLAVDDVRCVDDWRAVCGT